MISVEVVMTMVIAALVIGLVLGVIAMGMIVRTQFLAGRITAREIAEYCDQIIDAQQEATEEASPKRMPL